VLITGGSPLSVRIGPVPIDAVRIDAVRIDAVRIDPGVDRWRRESMQRGFSVTGDRAPQRSDPRAVSASSALVHDLDMSGGGP
jgi:hypothetical protein